MYRYKCYSQFRSKYQSFECYIGKEYYFNLHSLQLNGKRRGSIWSKKRNTNLLIKEQNYYFWNPQFFFYAPEHGFNLLEDKIGKTLLCVWFEVCKERKAWWWIVLNIMIIFYMKNIVGITNSMVLRDCMSTSLVRLFFKLLFCWGLLKIQYYFSLAHCVWRKSKSTWELHIC